MYKIFITRRFEKDVALCKRRNLDIKKLYEAMILLEQKGCLPAKYKPHKLNGKYIGLWECHLQPDWLLVWKQDDEQLIMLFTNTGSHSDLF